MVGGNMINSAIKEMKDKMHKSMEVLKEELMSVRAGRANPMLLDKVVVEYYGTQLTKNNIMCLHRSLECFKSVHMM